MLIKVDYAPMVNINLDNRCSKIHLYLNISLIFDREYKPTNIKSLLYIAILFISNKYIERFLSGFGGYIRLLPELIKVNRHLVNINLH